jgi:hypothetical protein
MLKNLALIGVLISQLAVISVLLPDHASSSESKQTHPKGESQPPPPVAPPETQVHNNVTSEPAAESTSQNDVWIRSGVVVNAVLVLVTIAIAWTGRLQAKAALLNAHNLANSERARIAYAGNLMGHSVEFSAKNVGRVVAGITYIRGFADTMPYGQPLPKTPKYLDGRNHTEADEWVSPSEYANIPQGEVPFMMADLSDPRLREAIGKKDTSLWIYARICHQDGVSAKIRETRFCLSVSIKDDGYPGFMRSGPPAYNYFT